MPKRTDINTVLIIGAGPIIIGQACEFDYSGTQACKALREEGYRVVLVNSNPATIMTDRSLQMDVHRADHARERSRKSLRSKRRRSRKREPRQVGFVADAQVRQTALNTAMSLHRAGKLDELGIEMIGANADAIERGEDRQAFKDAMLQFGLDVPSSGVAHTLDEALEIAEQIGSFPLIIRPAYTLGGPVVASPTTAMSTRR